MSGDNLGGFKQLSSAIRKCRLCMATASDMCEKVYISVIEKCIVIHYFILLGMYLSMHKNPLLILS